MDFEKAKSYALKLLLYKFRTSYQLKNKLLEKGYDEEIVDRVIEYMTEYGYLDDNKYVEGYIKDSKKFRNISKMMLKYKLREKGIDEEIIDGKLESLEFDEATQARKLAQKKMRSCNDVLKVRQYLMRKGFRNSTINEVIKGLM